MEWIIPLGAFGLLLATFAAKSRLALARDTRLNVRGKALFLPRTGALGVGALGALKYKEQGFTWAVIPWLWGLDGRRPNRDMAFYDELRRLNIPFVLMVWPTVDEWRNEIEETLSTAERLGAIAVLLDVERADEWDFDGARKMAEYASDRAHSMSLKIGLTSFGSAQMHANFPYKAFAPYMDFAIPQLYDPNLVLQESYFKNGFDAWIVNGFRCLILGLSEYERARGGGVRLKSHAAMRRYLSVAKDALQPHAAILWEHLPANQEFKQWRI